MRDRPTPLDEGGALLWLRTDADRNRLREAFDDEVVGLTATVAFTDGRRARADYEEELEDVAAEIRELGDGSVPERPGELREQERRTYETLKRRFLETKRTLESLDSHSVVTGAALVVLGGEPFPEDVASYVHARLATRGWEYALTAPDGGAPGTHTGEDFVDPHSVTEADVEARIEEVWSERE